MSTHISYIGNHREAEGDAIDLTNPEVEAWAKKHFPAVMANRPVGMSENYQFMPTHTMAKRMIKDFGLKLVEIGQQNSRSRDPSGQEHFLKFRLPTALSFKHIRDSVPELVIMNSHNGRSTVRAYAGVFRMVCSNGMVISEQSFGQIKLRHFGEHNTFANFNKVLTEMAQKLQVLDARLSKLDGILLSQAEQRRLARHVMKLRAVPDWVEPHHVLEVHRKEDELDAAGMRSAWVTFNVIQENLTTRTIVHEREGQRNVQLRPLSGARAHVLTNEKIWQGLELFLQKEMPHLASDLMDMQALEEVAEEKAKAAPRGAKEIFELATYDQICGVTDEEREALTSEERKKLSSRKSYLKRKENA
jgi:hypothetical protein